MTRPAEFHLSPDDIDALLADDARAYALDHLDTCAHCADVFAGEREVVESLAALPAHSPSAMFADHVMARMALPSAHAPKRPSAYAAMRPSAYAPLRLAAAVVLVLGASISIAWSLGNQETLAAAGTWLGNEAVSWLWLGIQGAASNLMEQPWYDRARGLLDAPARIALLSGAASLAYLGGVLALRRLMALPRAGAAHAHA